MKRILCYGDSNTWGASSQGIRLEDSKQWPNILQGRLGGDYHIIQEGLGGRVAGTVESKVLRYNGRNSFEVIYRSASPVDLVIIALGTNDLKLRYHLSASQIAEDLLWYQGAIQNFGFSEDKNTQVLYICPSNFSLDEGDFEDRQPLRSDLIARMREFNAPILEFNDLEMSSDGLHYADSAHLEVATGIGQKLQEMNI